MGRSSYFVRLAAVFSLFPFCLFRPKNADFHSGRFSVWAVLDCWRHRRNIACPIRRSAANHWMTS